jgi:membrane dipeptidase
VDPLSNDLSLLRVFYELGVRLIGLVWSRRNYAADGSHYSPVREGQKGGITEFGVQLIEEAERLGMVIDVSHLNDEGFWDVMEIARKPVIASHSNCRELADFMRNLSDEQIKAIASTDGVVGINAVNLLIADKDEESNLERLLDHVDHLRKLVGVEHIGLGLDISETFMKYFSQETLLAMSRKPFDAIKGHACVPKITEGLLRRKYKDSEIELILGKNFIRVYQQVWK